MKELSIEEKAKRYDEAISIAREYDFSLTGVCAGDVIQDIFPELKKSEDEMVKKELIEYHKAQAFLDGKPNNKHVKYVAWLEKQGEQKDILDEAVLDSNEDGLVADTIKYKNEQKPAWSEEDSFQLAAAINIVANSGHTCTSDWLKSIKDRVQPQPKQGWSEEDEKIALSIEQVMNCASLLNIVPDKIEKVKSWLKNLKDRVQQRQEWSEEDEIKETIRCTLLSCCNGSAINYKLPYDGYEKCLSWLKSIRTQNRWKPSEEQIGVIEAVINNRSFQRRYLDSLYEQLKKLREE